MPTDTRLNLLLRTLARVAVSVELEPTLQILLDSLYDLVAFDAGGIFVRDAGSGLLRARAVRGFPSDLHRPDAEGIVGVVIQTGTPRLVHDVGREPLYVPIRPQTAAQMTVPLASPRGVLGAISLEADHAHAFTDDDVALALLFAQQATIGVERALLHEQLIRQSRLDRDIEIARAILRSLTPAAPPAMPGMEIAGRSLTAESVGGDAFDFIEYPDGQLGVSISDATGKGLPAALVALAHQAMLQALVSVDLRLPATFARISDLLARSIPSSQFVTTFYGILDVSARRMVYANAGHPPPLIVRADRSIEALVTTGPALGFPRLTPVREAYAVFGPGDGLVLFTDGVTDAGPSPEAFLDVAGVQAAIGATWHHDAQQVVDRLLDEVRRRAQGPLLDDATVVVVKFE
jgi:sigma-B regulation protein RsbU (phosphoserine phosphatase)